MRSLNAEVALVALLLLLGGCASVGESTAPPATAPGQPVADDLRSREPAPDAVRFSIVSARSEIRLLTYRDGPMARLGHNHVITTSALTGTAWLTDELSDALVRIVVPASGLVVDDPDARADAGGEFAEPIPQEDIEATRENMLGDALLQADAYPFIRATCGDYRSGAGTIDCEIEVAGNATMLTLPVNIEVGTRRVRARGEATVTHAQLGLTPFSAAGGAIRVADGITVRIDIVAQRLSD